MDELDHPVLNQQLAAIEKAMTNAYPADPIRYAKLFMLHNRLQRRAQWVDAGSSLTRAVGEHADVRRRAVASSQAASRGTPGKPWAASSGGPHTCYSLEISINWPLAELRP
jgi:hypothetical protein